MPIVLPVVVLAVMTTLDGVVSFPTIQISPDPTAFLPNMDDAIAYVPSASWMVTL